MFYAIDPPAPANIMIMDSGPCDEGKRWQKVAPWPEKAPEHTGEFSTSSGYDEAEIKDFPSLAGTVQIIMIDGKVIGVVVGKKDGPGLRWVCTKK